MNTVTKKIQLFFSDKNLRTRLLFIIGFLVVFRLLSSIPVPGVDQAQLAQFVAGNQILGVLSALSGGGISTLSIVMLGVGPYITASIIMQLLTMMIPRLKEHYQENGEVGRVKFAQLSRVLTVPLAVIQGFSLLVLLQRQGILPSDIGIFGYVVSLSVTVAGSILLMWIGELLSEFGIGNGISFIIFAGIVAGIPTHISQFAYAFDPSQIPALIGFVVVGLLVIAGVVFVTDAERQIPVTYARQVHGNRVIGGTSTYLPVRLNQAGVMPIIFAVSILLFPQLVGTLLAKSTSATGLAVSKALIGFVNSTWAYAVVYFALVVLFTYFYTAITFDPEQMATNLQKNGAFVPGIRPGEATMRHITKIVTRLTLFGAVFLGFIAVIPLIAKSVTGISAIALGGTSLLIVVSVVIDLIKRIDAQLSLKEY